MTQDTDEVRPEKPTGRQQREAARAARLAAAMRENLKRRKEQARGMAERDKPD